MPVPLLLYTYLLTQILAPFYASFVILSSVLVMGNLIRVLDVILDFGIGFADFTRLLAYLTPQLLLFAIPMASMMGVILCFTRLSSDNEILALKSCGVGIYRMLPPIVMLALCTAALTWLFSVHLFPAGNIAKDTLLFQLTKTKLYSGLQAKRFSQNLGDIVVYADKIDPDTKELHGVYVSDLRDKKHPITILAKAGTISTHETEMTLTLKLMHGSMHRTEDDISQSIDFSAYTLNLPFASFKNTIISKQKDILTQAQLLEEAAKHGLKTKTGAGLMHEYHKRIVLPVCCFILTILGFPLGLLRTTSQRAPGILMGLCMFTIYFILLVFAENFSKNLILPVPVAMWSPVIVFSCLTVYLIRNAAQEKSIPILSRIDDIGHSVAKLFLRHKR